MGRPHRQQRALYRDVGQLLAEQHTMASASATDIADPPDAIGHSDPRRLTGQIKRLRHASTQPIAIGREPLHVLYRQCNLPAFCA